MSKIGIPKNTTNTAALVELPQVTETSNRASTTLAVEEKSSTDFVLDLPFLLRKNTSTLAANTAVNSSTFTLTSGHGTIIGDIVELASQSNKSVFIQAQVLGVAGDVITVDTPMNFAYSVADTTVNISSRDMAVTAGNTFSIKPNTNQKGEIVKVICVLADNANMDFEGFGGLAALTNGIVLRINKGDGTYRNIDNFKTNGEMENFAFDAKYYTNVGGTVKGFTCRMTFGGESKHGAVIYLDGAIGESLDIIVQDDLTGLLSMRWTAQGKEV